MTVKSKAEIMEHMTLNVAVKTVSGMNTSTDLKALIATKFGRALQRKIGLRVSQLQGPTGYSALDKAVDMLNEMGEESNGNFEREQERCRVFKESTEAEMTTARDAVLYFNGKASEARGRVIEAQGIIMTTTEELHRTTEALDQLRIECNNDIVALESQLTVVLSDIKVMANILGMTDCGEDKLLLVECQHCGGAVLVQHGKLQDELNKLQSSEALQSVQETLKSSYTQSLNGKPAMALTQEMVQHFHLRSRHHKKRLRRSQYPVVGALNTSDVPIPPKPVACVPTNKCSIASSPNCQKLKDRFLVVQAGIVEKRDELRANLEARRMFCREQEESMTTSIENMETTIREAHTNFAVGTEEQNQAEKGSHTQNKAHTTLSTNYETEMTKCCDNQNMYRSEICALTKIRGELEKMEGQKTFITDCEVTDWQMEDCSVSCGGGTMTKARKVVVHPVGKGMRCPPLEEEVSCNMKPCPVDCVLGDWSGWSSCSAECGGGVKERSRNIKVEASNSGTPCESTEEEQACGMQSCDEDCVLSDWSAWSSCSKACGGGSMRRTKEVLEPARGTGECAAADDEPLRLNFHECNDFDCARLLPTNRSIVECQSKVDMIILVDGSGSLGQYGWDQSQKLAKKIVNNLEGSNDMVKVSLQLFSGPKTWADYEKCTDELPAGETLDLKEQCGIEWASHFTDDMGELAKTVKKLVWPAATTLTSVALGQAESELVYGREDANAVVVVITDGKPMNQVSTIAAAKKLQEKARVIWVPVGGGAPTGMISEVASKPVSDHVVEISDFSQVTWKKNLNAIITDACPIVG